MQSGSMWLGLAGLMLVGILMSRSYKGSIIIGAAPCPAVAQAPAVQMLMPNEMSRLGWA